MSVYEDENVGYGFREGEGGFEEGPGVRVGIEDDDQERWGCRCRGY